MPSRAPYLSRLLLAATLALPATLSGTALAQDPNLTREMIVADPAAPVSGNPKGDVTIVAFLDYNCPFCKKSAPELEKLVKTDGKIRLVYKDWPILSEASVAGAKLALAAKYQGKYDAAHKALMGIPGRRIQPDQMLEAVKASGVDMPRLQADANIHSAAITELLKRNDAQARALQLQGTPVYLVGPLLVSAALDYKQFKEAVAEARSRAKKS